MRILVFYKSVSEHGRSVEEFMHEFTRRTGRDLESVDPDSREGGIQAETYDVVEYPTIIALRSDGSELARWRGTLPTISEVSYYNE
jgi:methyl coenzyme M reductase alpha subunit